MVLTPRGRAQRWLSSHRGLTEQPPGSNTDSRPDGIRAAQLRLGAWLLRQPWCGVWACNAALAGGVKITYPWRWASVANIEEDAKDRRNGFRGWVGGPIKRTGAQWGGVYRSDLVVLFGHGVHVETIRDCSLPRRLTGWIVTDGGNTSSGDDGSQDNGGGSYRRYRRISDIYGIAKVNYPS